MEENKNEKEEMQNSSIQVLEKEEQNNAIEETKELKNIEQLDEKQENNKNKNLIIVISTIIVLLIAILFFTIFAIINMGNSKIIKGITIGNIDVSNMTKEEAKKVLDEISAKKEENQIYLTYGEYETQITFKALEVEFQTESAVQEAYDTGRKGNIFIDNIEIIKTWINPSS